MNNCSQESVNHVILMAIFKGALSGWETKGQHSTRQFVMQLMWRRLENS